MLGIWDYLCEACMHFDTDGIDGNHPYCRRQERGDDNHLAVVLGDKCPFGYEYGIPTGFPISAERNAMRAREIKEKLMGMEGSGKDSKERTMEISDYEYEKLTNDADENRLLARCVCIGIIVVFALVALGLWGCPQYGVWRAEMEGKAQLSNAEYAKQVMVQEANANLEAEKLNAEAEVARAQGAADARNVEGLGMTSEEYIQYLWVKKLSLAESSVIYLPSEGGLPVLTLDANEKPQTGE